MMNSPCIEHATRLGGVEARTERIEAEQATTACVLRKLQSSSRATLVAAIATPVGAVLAGVVAGWFGLQQTKEQARNQAGEKARQVVQDEDRSQRAAETERAVSLALQRQSEAFQSWVAHRELEAAKAEEHRLAAARGRR